MSADLTAPIFTNEDKAREHFEALRWPEGRTCPHCGVIGNSTLMQGKSTRPGLYKCKDCRKPFTATMGTVYERSHIPLHKWLLATHLMCSSKKGMSAHQLFRMLGFGSYKTAWFMAHRIREAMRTDDLAPFGSDGGDVEVDETYYAEIPGADKKGGKNKMAVVSLVERNTGKARSIVTDRVTTKVIGEIVAANMAKEARLITDQSNVYFKVGATFSDHQSVNHSRDKYVSKLDPTVHTNTVEGFYSIFKRGMRGVYQHCAPYHLHRYVAEFDFRYSERSANGVSDKLRAEKAVAGTVGKRLTYRRTYSDQVAA